MDLADLRNIGIVILAVEVFLVSLVPAAIFFFLIWGVTRLMAAMRIRGPVVRGYFRKAAETAEQTSQQIASPFVSAHAATAHVHGWLSSLSRSSKAKEEV
jgi:hypothetical protein